MSRSKRRGDNTAPALFPFLAVLLCTIGALVLILVITVANSHASARKEAEESIADIEDTTEMMEVVSVELEAQREDLKARVERRRRELADIEDHISRLTKSLDQLTSKIQRIHADSSQTEADHSQKHLPSVPFLAHPGRRRDSLPWWPIPRDRECRGIDPHRTDEHYRAFASAGPDTISTCLLAHRRT